MLYHKMHFRFIFLKSPACHKNNFKFISLYFRCVRCCWNGRWRFFFLLSLDYEKKNCTPQSCFYSFPCIFKTRVFGSELKTDSFAFFVISNAQRKLDNLCESFERDCTVFFLTKYVFLQALSVNFINQKHFY